MWFGLKVGRQFKHGPGLLSQRMFPLIFVSLILVFAVAQMIGLRSAGDLSKYVEQPTLVNLHDFIESGIDHNVFLEQVLVAVPERRPYVGGLSFLSTFVLFVPRQLWLDKPSTAWAYMSGYFDESFTWPNISVTILGELYLNFGLPGVILGMFVVGVFSRFWFNFYRKHKGSATSTVLYCMSLPAFAFLVRGDFQVAVGHMLYPMLLVILVLRASRLKARKVRTAEIPTSARETRTQ